MSRMSNVEPIPVQAGNNIYTVLVVAATIITALATTVLFLKFNTAFGDWPFTMQQ
jgi:spore maturation protein SpmA